MISIIVPCYNEQEALPFFHEEISRVLKEIGEDYELLFVNDGSKDDTLKELKALSTKDPHVIYLSFSRNFGKEAAMYAGFCNAKGDYIAVMDADLQDPPALLPEMLKMLETDEYDSVATRRVSREGEPPIRSWFARRFYDIMNRISESDIVDGARDFRLMKKSMVDAIVAMGEYNRFSKGLFGWVGFRTYWMPYENVERVAGETKWNFWKLFKYAIDGIINFSHVWNDNDLLFISGTCSHHYPPVDIRRSGCRLGFYCLCSYLYWRNPALVSWNYGTVHIKDISGDKTQTTFYHSRDK